MWRDRFIAYSLHRSKSFTTASFANQPLIVSRRAWQAYRKKNPSSAAPKNPLPKEDEKPWPRNLVLAGYAAAAVFIPYSIGWFLSMNAEARHMIAPLIPGLEEALRSHFGHDEYVSYQDRKYGEIAKKKLDDEDTFEVRRQQEIIAALNAEEVPAQLYIFNDGGMVTRAVKLPGTTLATPSTLLNDGSTTGTVALDFDDLPSSSDGDFENELSSHEIAKEKLADHIYSSWYYQPPSIPQGRQQTQQTTAQDIEESRLEYMIEQLQLELRNVHSVRDIDDMRDELARYRSELRSLRWKRRLGLTK